MLLNKLSSSFFVFILSFNIMAGEIFHLADEYKNKDNKFLEYQQLIKNVNNEKKLYFINRIEDLKSFTPHEDEFAEYKIFTEREKIPNYKRLLLKNNFYSKYENWSPPKISYYGKANYEFWDAVFLWFMLENHNNLEFQKFFYHHRETQGIKDFILDVKRFYNVDKMQNNYLYKLEESASKTKDEMDSGFTIQNIPNSIYFHRKYISSNFNEQTEITHSDIEVDINVCEDTQKNNKQIKCIETKSPIESLMKFINGDSNGTIVNADLWDDFKNAYKTIPSNKIKKIDEEFLFFLSHDGSGIHTLNDLKMSNDKRIITFDENSYNSIKIILSSIPEYKHLTKKITQVQKSPVITLIMADKNSVFFQVCDIKCDFLEELNKNLKSLKMLPLDDWRIANKVDKNGYKIYSLKNVPYIYNNLQEESIYNSKTQTPNLTINKYLVIADDL